MCVWGGGGVRPPGMTPLLMIVKIFHKGNAHGGEPTSKHRNSACICQLVVSLSIPSYPASYNTHHSPTIESKYEETTQQNSKMNYRGIRFFESIRNVFISIHNENQNISKK